MHPNPIYRRESRDRNLAFARDVGFGALAVPAPDAAPLVAQAPFVFNDDGTLDLHLMRSNPVMRAAPAFATLIVQGPHGYISPDWYGMADQVPTWNYVAVHLTGRVDPLPQDRLRPVLDRLAEEYERRLLPKPIWTSDKVPEEIMTRLMRAIQPLRMQLTGVEGTWKLAQNKPADARRGAAEGLEQAALLPGAAALAAWMRAVTD
ncbi:FMN-binding negative transcriptional regulator [Pseudooceanicola aestuarii]|uniref:FMN-binding negative transcriptional regulator n=1 Tax=Pseudooceanicola aestuarii TaxID=2697319 RepID=UPI0013D2EB18|nr:FMN-binding negative transcriptional regulator [Pseudooceanicola aestuarii]